MRIRCYEWVWEGIPALGDVPSNNKPWFEGSRTLRVVLWGCWDKDPWAAIQELWGGRGTWLCASSGRVWTCFADCITIQFVSNVFRQGRPNLVRNRGTSGAGRRGRRGRRIKSYRLLGEREEPLLPAARWTHPSSHRTFILPRRTRNRISNRPGPSGGRTSETGCWKWS